ncbi:circularly permuted type 2 ATP-grasp protein [Polaribacter sargassicola]|uniref:circularly permuted type 2 ATP-grasp protein n=1 Tax=Polaribacter sargassicola TaxID=2836891 RepID=UPI001F4813AF|nr:circularly permuted type 2 ATP-grasp protein [Polaribacter sp. DS7-9]MCG1036835.1 circularly permuted type 2 ATP-grasp protein [Polaribacter sp. DS7-9]
MPDKNLFEKYFNDFEDYDEVLKSDMTINPNWEKLLNNFSTIGQEELTEKQKQIDWLLAENGVTYNVYNDPKGLNRPWSLNIIPFIIEQKEWLSIEKGLKQRAELLDLTLKDIYGKRELIKNKIIPPEVVYSHRGFLRNCDQIQYNTSKNLLIHSADLARGPDGRMWVVNDRTEAPSGMGYSLENRFSIRHSAPDLSKNIHVEQPFSFFKDYHQLLIDSAPVKKKNTTIVILTPGPHNETYFEHAYLSSYLGYPLVKGNDLVVRNNKVFIKTLKELIQVDVILRRVDGAYTDPLELKGNSFLGVAGLLNVVRKNNVSIINPIGSGVLENPGLIPFMNSICKYFFKEDLILPQIASWWCGQEKERNFVLENLTKLVVKPIDRTNREHIYFCELLSSDELEELKKQILEKPYRFVAQEKISFSTAPNFTNKGLEPRKVVCRTFSVAKNDSYSVMPGGLVRVAAEKEKLRVSNQRGGTSKDFWITNSVKTAPTSKQRYHWHNNNTNTLAGIDNLPSHTAENLFWSGRYLARTLVTARYIRMVLNELVDSDSKSLDVLLKSITHLTSIFPGFTGINEEAAFKDPLKEIAIVLFDKNKQGSLAYSIQAFSNSYYSLRNLWSKDMWRVFDATTKSWNDFSPENHNNLKKIIKLLDSIITKLIAFMCLIEESILVEQGLLLYFIGLQTEQAMMCIDKSRALLVSKYDEQTEYEILESLLDSHESLNIYRYSFRSHLNIKNVINLILLDKSYSRSLKYQLNRIRRDVSRLPNKNQDIKLSNSYLLIKEACDLIENADVDSFVLTEDSVFTRAQLDEFLAKLSNLIHQTSLSITNTYFNHSDQQQRQLIHQKQSV